jgi:hypothetical protein
MLTGTARLLAHPWNALHCDRKILTEVLNKYPGPAVLKLVAKDVRNGNGAGIRIARFLIRDYNSEMRGTGQKRLKYV